VQWGKLTHAKTEFNAAKEIAHHKKVDKMWLELIAKTEEMVRG
jgi:hypothetical protein